MMEITDFHRAESNVAFLHCNAWRVRAALWVSSMWYDEALLKIATVSTFEVRSPSLLDKRKLTLQ